MYNTLIVMNEPLLNREGRALIISANGLVI